MTYKEQKEQIDNNIFARIKAMNCDEYDEIMLGAKVEDLQQRIDKAIELCNIVIKNEPLQATPNEELLDQICGIKSILKDEEVKDND